ncbi:MAG: hypothetical protein CV080_09140 [Candidatus Kuenenia stuttgartiensis]|jgi:hypothetical protein|uniref:Uncharacterized protein n=1 Tax=Kuenenia stuttgartiensis TaxID=174633 RepID=Q1Q0Q6_KUEST|nr:MAG: hypothetical protein CV080_09140 [Candidatus Kuenenia stuttgartiensis]CAJ73583.1 unknown protein [Candidatus Kuenenia stuttgartiensis]SOH02538.1 hypothetical protein KSMBR1_0016 [Candidatus Kuenenia stuttgartiensis]
MGGAGILPLRNTGRNACTTLAINFIIHLPKNLIFLLIFTKNRECPRACYDKNNFSVHTFSKAALLPER